MGKRLGVVGVVVEDLSAAEEVNAVLHEYARVLIGRMGIPHMKRELNVIVVIVNATTDGLGALTGKLGKVAGVSVKSALSKAE